MLTLQNWLKGMQVCNFTGSLKLFQNKEYVKNKTNIPKMVP